MYFKIILVCFVLLSLNAKADYLYTKYSNRCVYNLTPKQNDKGWCWIYTDNNNSSCNKNAKRSQFIDGYIYDVNDDTCLMKNDLKISGLSQSEWDYLLAILAHVMGFTMLFLINFLSILIVRK